MHELFGAIHNLTWCLIDPLADKHKWRMVDIQMNIRVVCKMTPIRQVLNLVKLENFVKFRRIVNLQQQSAQLFKIVE